MKWENILKEESWEQAINPATGKEWTQQDSDNLAKKTMAEFFEALTEWDDWWINLKNIPMEQRQNEESLKPVMQKQVDILKNLSAKTQALITELEYDLR